MKKLRTLLVDSLRIFGCFIIPCFFILMLDLIVYIVDGDFLFWYSVSRKVQYLVIYMIVACFALVAWMAVILALAYTRRYSYIYKDSIIKTLFYISLVNMFIAILLTVFIIIIVL